VLDGSEDIGIAFSAPSVLDNTIPSIGQDITGVYLKIETVSWWAKLELYSWEEDDTGSGLVELRAKLTSQGGVDEEVLVSDSFYGLVFTRVDDHIRAAYLDGSTHSWVGLGTEFLLPSIVRAPLISNFGVTASSGHEVEVNIEKFFSGSSVITWLEPFNTIQASFGLRPSISTGGHKVSVSSGFGFSALVGSTRDKLIGVGATVRVGAAIAATRSFSAAIKCRTCVGCNTAIRSVGPIELGTKLAFLSSLKCYADTQRVIINADFTFCIASTVGATEVCELPKFTRDQWV
jgi:hypothetical protein